MKSRYLMIRITEEQKIMLENKAKNAGFKRKSDYIRSILFLSSDTEQMIKEIYKRVVKNG